MGAIAALFAALNYKKLHEPFLSIGVGLSPIKNVHEENPIRDRGIAYIYYKNNSPNFFKNFSMYCIIRCGKTKIDASYLFPKNAYIEPLHENEVSIEVRRLLEEEKAWDEMLYDLDPPELPEPEELEESEDQLIQELEEQMLQDPQEQELQQQLKNEQNNTVYITLCYSYHYYGLKKKCTYLYRMNIKSGTRWIQIIGSKHPCNIFGYNCGLYRG